MQPPKLIRITTVPISLEKLLEGQINFIQNYFEVTAVSANKARLKELGIENDFTTFHVEMSRQITPISDLKAVWKLYKYLKREKPTIVHTHTPKAGIIGMMASYLARVPLRLHTVAGLPLMEAKGVKRKILNLVERWTYKYATNVYPNSKGLYDFILSEKLTSHEKLQIIGNGSSNGIDTSYFDSGLFSQDAKDCLKKEIHIPKESFVFIFVGRLVGDKGINELVKAFSNLNSEFRIQNSKLLLVGLLESDLDPLLPKTLEAIENDPDIIEVGYQQDVRPYFAISDALVFPSYREGFPNVVMQAGAMGLPSIVSDINGCNEIIEEGVNGMIIPPKNTVELKKAMISILEDSATRQMLASNSRSMIVSRYERQQVWDALLKEYNTLLASL